MQKNSTIIDLIKLPKNTGKRPHLLERATVDIIDKGVIANGEIGSTQNAMFVDDNLLAEIWGYLKLSLSCSI